MRLYFWDWNNSLTIEMCDMENPFPNNDLARKNDCFTNLESAKLAAKIDLRERIAELHEALKEIELITVSSVVKVPFIRGM